MHQKKHVCRQTKPADLIKNICNQKTLLKTFSRHKKKKQNNDKFAQHNSNNNKCNNNNNDNNVKKETRPTQSIVFHLCIP